MRCDTLWTDARVATMADEGLGALEDAVVAQIAGKLVYVGARVNAPAFEAAETIRCDGRWITPGLIDCHTHLVHAGDRANEFQLRLDGVAYEEIARAGGGIVSTVNATRAATSSDMVSDALRRLDVLIAEGVTTIEVKSGYGLELGTELKMLRAARSLADKRPVRISTTFLGAHALPPEYCGDADAYVKILCDEWLPEVARLGLADAVDAFCERIAFSRAQVARIFESARVLGLPMKIHAEQLSNQRGAELAAGFGALSADHLEYLDDHGVAAMGKAGTIATLLPGAYYFMRETRQPPVSALRAAGVPIAIATDCNPGTSPLTSLLLTMNMGATLFRLTVEECLRGVTINAARALGLHHEIGSLESGKRCDLAIWDIERPAELVYRMGFNPLYSRIWSGQ